LIAQTRLTQVVHLRLGTSDQGEPLIEAKASQNGKVRTMKKTLLALAAAALALPAVPAAADPPGHAPAHGWRAKHRNDVRYDRYGRYAEPRRIHRGDRIWRDGRDGRYYCRRDNGTTGLIIGAAGGAFLGRGIDTHGERTTGTILGAALGALLGREIDRGELRCR
jgi:hypothetical protein